MIRIAKLTDYAIVIASYFAKGPGSSTRNARDLAATTKLPLPTVSKILKALSRAGLLVSQRGVKGGYMLARAPERISVADVVCAIEGPIALTECSSNAPGLCILEGSCPVRENWRRINGAVVRALSRLSIAEMASPMGEVSDDDVAGNAPVLQLLSQKKRS